MRRRRDDPNRVGEFRDLLRVEFQDANGKPIPGFSLEECEPIYGDHIARTVRWNGNPDLAKLAGRNVRIRFEMSDADLYSLKFN